jgi:hypothetical protein
MVKCRLQKCARRAGPPAGVFALARGSAVAGIATIFRPLCEHRFRRRDEPSATAEHQ